MGRSYSMDLRERVVGRIVDGHSRRSTARYFGVSESFAIKLMQRHDREGSAAPPRQGRPRGSGKLDPFETFLIDEVERQPDITMPELAAKLLEIHGMTAAPAVLSRFLCRRGFTYKKIADGSGVRTRSHS
ncbi:Transposase [Fulvimarina manganoxydans]|uniref:Transposase n=1 Tax=Fulvimarina manganoxydans TaxID=937218 RepID=A0A1W2C3N9_9HYPH|nr:Transposase [Fulvimarina manganoxydans]